MTIQEVRNLVAASKLDKALDAALQLPQISGDDEHRDTILLYQNQYKSNERENRMSLLTPAEYNQTRSRISFNLLSMLSELEDEGETMAPPPPPSPPPPPPPVDSSVTKILFLAASPYNMAKLQLEKEHSRVSARLQDALEPQRYPIRLKQAVTPSEFQEYLNEERPNIVHFSGHGDLQMPELQQALLASRAGRPPLTPAKEKEESGIFLLSEDDHATAHFVGTGFLRRTFKTMIEGRNIPIQAVVFNACHSSEQAQAVSEVVPYVVGTSSSVGDKAAIAFSTGFYYSIAQGHDIETAVDFGINQALAYNEPEDRFLLYKNGQKVVL